MIPNNTSNFLPFVKLPNPLKDNKGEICEGDAVTIITELSPPENPKIKSFLIGEIEIVNGDRRTIGLNMTSYYNVSKAYGNDTKLWIGKEIVFCGFKTLGKGNGFLWSAQI
jgi:hypothetical protein